MKLERFPGFLGLTSRGIVAIHADWPAYAVDHGWEYALWTFARFPRGTAFFGIDDIDQCILLFVGDPNSVRNPSAPEHLHVAAWHEDLLELKERGYVAGIEEITATERARIRMESFPEHLYYENTSGELVEISRDDLVGHIDDEDELFPLVSESGVTVTDSGFAQFEKLMQGHQPDWPRTIRESADELIGLRRYDTAIREACLQTEVMLRRLT